MSIRRLVGAGLVLLLGMCVLLSGCGRKGEADAGGAQGTAAAATTPEGQALDAALVALGNMVAAGKADEWPEAKRAFEAFRTAYAKIAPRLQSKDPGLHVRIGQATEELGQEFAPGRQARAFELSEEGVKLSKLLADAAAALELPVQQEHLLVKLDVEPPYTQVVELNVELKDYAFDPAEISVGQNAKVILHVRNTGPHAHELEVAHFERELSLQPGEQNDLVLYALEAGEFELACHMPGHYEVGMKGRLVVKAAP